MTDSPPGARPANASDGGRLGVELCVLIACFAGHKHAGKIRRQLDQRITRSGDTILDQVVVKVNAKHTAFVYDPRRTLGGILAPALMWGIFGLLAGGLRSLAVWAVLGAICGGLYAYYFEHLLTKDELKRIGARLPGNSSAIVAFVKSRDPHRVLSSIGSLQTATASVAAITTDLSAQVYPDPAQPAKASATAADPAPTTATDHASELSMVLLRFVGEHTARQSLPKSGTAGHRDKEAPQVELVIETNNNGRRRVISPTAGSLAFSKPDAVSWGLFGLVWGAIVGFASDGGILSSIENGLVTGILWAAFGLIAGALYGLWAGRGVSARRLKGFGPLLPPGTSLVIAWAEGSPSREMIQRWAAPASQRLILRFNPARHGAVLEV